MTTPTPLYHHVKNYESVYEPSEDTFLLLDSLEVEKSSILLSRPKAVLEIGCGSGIVTAFLSQILGPFVSYMCTDKNIDALRCCSETARLNGLHVENIATDLVTSLLPRAKHQIDLLLFNPPYVVTPSDEVQLSGLASAWAGGTDGREVMDRLFPLVPLILSESGLFYLVVVEENKPREIRNLFEQWGFDSSVIMKRRSGPELLSVIKFWRFQTE